MFQRTVRATRGPPLNTALYVNKYMNTPEELNRLLSACCEQLVDCSASIKEMPLDPANRNIYRIGKALAEVSEIRSELYKLHPHLKPEKWDEPPSEEDYAEMYQEAIRQVTDHLRGGNPKRAIETLESYLFIGPSEKYENLANEEIKKIRGKYGV